MILQLEEHFDLIVRHLYNYKIVVTASTASRELFERKTLTPATFLRPFFKVPTRNDFTLIDVEDYCRPKEKPMFDKIKDTLNRSLVNPKSIARDSYRTRNDVEDHLNNQAFLWFLEASKLYMDSVSYEYDTTTIDQPMAVVHIMSVDDADFSQQYIKVVKTTNQLLKLAYKLNPKQYLNVETLVIVLIDKSRGKTIEQALKISSILKEQHRVKGNLICRIDINGEEAEDMGVWSGYRRNSYFYKSQAKQSDVIRIVSQQTFNKLSNSTNEFQQMVRDGISRRIQFLNQQFKESSKVSAKIFSAFNTANNDRDKYSETEVETRELGDLSFIERDYKKAYECYKDLSGKFENRNRGIYVSLLEMLSHCHVYAKLTQIGLKGDPYQQVEKEAKVIFQHSSYFIKYSVLMIYSMYALKTLRKEFIKEVFYPKLKQRLKAQGPIPPIMVYLLEEQYATFHLSFQPVIEYRSYAQALLKVGMHFVDAKLNTNAYRCFLIIEGIYKNTFSVIEIFVYTYLAKMCMENKNFPACVGYLRKGWNIISSRINDEKYNQFIKNYEKIAAGLEEVGAANYLEREGLRLKFPVVVGMDVSTEDDYSEEKLPRMNAHNSKPSGAPDSHSWTEMGAEYFGSDNISKNNNALEYRKLGGFDALTMEQKYLANRYKPVGIAGRQVDKNARVCFIGERIRVQVWLQNPLNQQIEITRCALKLGEAVANTDYTCEPAFHNIKFNKSQERVVEFIIVPKRTGLFEITELSWHFSRLLSTHSIPEYSKEGYVNFYYKFMAREPVGQLRLVPKILGQGMFVGELQRVPVMLINQGSEPIDEVTIVSNDQRLFGWRMLRTPITLAPGARFEQTFNLRVYDEKCDRFKLLFIYRSKQSIRLKRLMVRLTPEIVVLFRDVKCQKISSHIHILTLEMLKAKEQQQAGLMRSVNLMDDSPQNNVEMQQLVLGNGFKILKHESTKTADRSVYTLFLQKNPHANKETLKFRDSSIEETEYTNFLEADEKQRKVQWANYQNKYYPYNHVDRMDMVVLFRYGGRLGVFHPQRIATNPKLLKILDKTAKIQDLMLPFNFRIRYPTEVEHNFAASPTHTVDVEVYLKNIFTESDMLLTVEFIDQDQAQGFWEGITLHEIRLRKDQQVMLPVKYTVTDAGLYDLSRIRYVLHKQRNKAPLIIVHNVYEHIYMEVTNEKTFGKTKNTHPVVAPPVETDLLS